MILVDSLFRYMISNPKRDPGPGSYIEGCSVHDQRIERLWREVFYGCTSYFYELFWYLEIRGYLDVENLFLFGPCSISFSQELMNYCTSLLLDGIHTPSPHQLIKCQNNYGSLAWLETHWRKYA